MFITLVEDLGSFAGIVRAVLSWSLLDLTICYSFYYDYYTPPGSYGLFLIIGILTAGSIKGEI